MYPVILKYTMTASRPIDPVLPTLIEILLQLLKSFGPIVRLLNTATKESNSYAQCTYQKQMLFPFPYPSKLPKSLVKKIVYSITYLQRCEECQRIIITNVFFFLNLQVTFTPQEKGKHRVYVYLHGMEVKG